MLAHSRAEQRSLFQDRHDAGKKLAETLLALKGRDCVVLGIPRGGMPVAAEVAAALDAPLDMILVRTIGAPKQPSLSIGTVMGGHFPVITPDRNMLAITGTNYAQFEEACQHMLSDIGRRWRFYCGERQPEILFGRTVIVVDDGLANGDTMRAALRSVRQCEPQLLVMAVPVMPPGTLESFRDDADVIVSVTIPSPFSSVGDFYSDFEPVTDDEVIQLLDARSPVSNISYHRR